ncbi:flagellar FliJ family protein [Planosporangium sp. 12N6]|uniref:flagellar FliJ family protein n=1 Tax=Planosporangium spinosum TaxID=3402278 RepID=UPI003CF4D3D4
MKRFRLRDVLRARLVQENSARGELLRARREAAEAAERVRRMDAAIGARPRPDSPSGVAFAATMWARQAMAGELSIAVAAAGEADATVDARTEDLTAAATRRRIVEKLAERHAEAERAAEQAAEQREVDDLTSTRNRGGNHTR